MTTYNEVFDEKQYRSVNLKAAQMYMDLNVSSALPLITTEIFDAYEYLHPILDEATGVTSGIDYVETGRKMNVRHEHEVVELFVTQGLIQVRDQDIWKYGENLLADKFDANIAQLVKRIDDSAFHGPKNDGGLQIAEGLIGQLTTLENKSSDGGHACATKGEIWRWIKAMVEDIPLAMRQEGPPMILYMNEVTFNHARGPERVYNDEVEWGFIYRDFIGPEAIDAQKIGQIIVTNKINAEASDNTADSSNGADTADTLGTDGRMLLCVPDKRWGGRIESAGFHKVGEDKGMLSVDMLFGWHGRFYIFDEDAYNYTERLSF